MALLECRGDTSIFTASCSTNATLPDNKIHSLESGTTNDRSLAVPLVIGWLLVSGRGVSLLPDAVKTETSPRYSNLVVKLCICLLGLLHISSNVFSTTLVSARYLILGSTFFCNKIVCSTSLCNWVADTWDRPHVSSHVSGPIA
jgi:hypothetical protein